MSPQQEYQKPAYYHLVTKLRVKNELHIGFNVHFVWYGLILDNNVHKIVGADKV